MKLAEVLRLYLDASPEIRGTQRETLVRLQSDPLAAVNAKKLKAKDFIDFAVRRGRTVSATTIASDFSHLRGALEYAQPGLGLEGVTAAALNEAKPLLRRKRLIGSSNKRTRVPTPAETAGILAWLRNSEWASVIADVVEFQDVSGRRISESCRIVWGDFDAEKGTVLVRAMKHPRLKTSHNKLVALTKEAIAIILRQPRATNDPEERIFKARSKTVQEAYRRAWKALGIKGLQLRDSRRGTTTRLLRAGHTVTQVMQVTGQLTRELVLTTYNGMLPEDFHRSEA